MMDLLFVVGAVVAVAVIGWAVRAAREKPHVNRRYLARLGVFAPDDWREIEW